MTTFKIIIPFRNGPRRMKNLEFVQKFWRHRFPDSQIVVADSGDQPFNKCRTVNETFRATPSADCTIIADCDCFVMDAAIKRAKVMFWGRLLLPHNSFAQLNEQQSDDVLAVVPPDQSIGGRIYRKVRARNPACGGVWFVDSDILDQHPMDEEFRGWGGDDVEYLNRVPHQRIDGPVYHLFHPIASRANRDKHLARIAQKKREHHARQIDLFGG